MRFSLECAVSLLRGPGVVFSHLSLPSSCFVQNKSVGVSASGYSREICVAPFFGDLKCRAVAFSGPCPSRVVRCPPRRRCRAVFPCAYARSLPEFGLPSGADSRPVHAGRPGAPYRGRVFPRRGGFGAGPVRPGTVEARIGSVHGSAVRAPTAGHRALRQSRRGRGSAPCLCRPSARPEALSDPCPGGVAEVGAMGREVRVAVARGL